MPLHLMGKRCDVYIILYLAKMILIKTISVEFDVWRIAFPFIMSNAD